MDIVSISWGTLLSYCYTPAQPTVPGLTVVSSRYLEQYSHSQFLMILPSRLGQKLKAVVYTI